MAEKIRDTLDAVPTYFSKQVHRGQSFLSRRPRRCHQASWRWSAGAANTSTTSTESTVATSPSTALSSSPAAAGTRDPRRRNDPPAAGPCLYLRPQCMLPRHHLRRETTHWSSTSSPPRAEEIEPLLSRNNLVPRDRRPGRLSGSDFARLRGPGHQRRPAVADSPR